MTDLRYCALMIERSWRGRTSPMRRCRNLASEDSLFCALHLRKLPMPLAPMGDDEAAWELDVRTLTLPADLT